MYILCTLHLQISSGNECMDSIPKYTVHAMIVVLQFTL